MHTLPTPAPITTVLGIPAARIQLIAADRTDTTVQIQPADPAKNRDVRAAQHTTVTYDDGILHIQAPTPENRASGPSGSIEITIQLPTGSHLQTKAASAELRGVGRLGNVTVEAAQGSVKLAETTNAHLTVLDGDITIGHLNGPARISVHKGDIDITRATHGTVELRTESGDITVSAAPGTSAALNAGTPYGRIHNALKNDGATTLDIHATTSYGDITARSL
ncbi:DUF4097 family beta strand repeat-containing protein [Nocardiopsis sp. HUAS JQ3]|uniref:DUF4097 family beta strand repeat-containing protein n=1 Tax=Nocardiopsis sp. HUAS JQ3 TaxID=3061629 RepID=UPI0023A99F07|nr:DUF4097 family beta strand repeat-containing protein [Nocardiopsis sp. HUAS JQ3]WDZ92138.1 DUF4097 family beta strand repeat-containing protein [Nocardiopsis sp. HUAS JQ3]